MTLNDLIPGLRSPKPRKANRAEVKLARTRDHLAAVQEDNAKLLNFKAATDDFFALLQQDRQHVYAAWEWAEQRRQEAEMVAACTQRECDELAAEVDRLNGLLAPQLAAEANAHRINVPPMVRDTSAFEDQATEPIPVLPLWEAVGVRYMGPDAASPAHVPSWAVVDEPQEVA